MRALLVSVLVVAACSFPRPDDSGVADGPPGGDGPASCVSGLIDLCRQAAPTQALTVAAVQKINTDTDSRCRTVAQNGGPDLCLLYFTRVEIPVGAELIAHGTRPLALAATSQIWIDGTLDVASTRVRSGAMEFGAGSQATCPFGSAPEDDGGGGGGGAGGSFATVGGDGGTGDLDDGGGTPGDAPGGTAGAVVSFTALRGGCPGQRGQTNGIPTTGNGGRGGGAVYVAAPTILITGKVLAHGAGGTGGGADDQGGAGGGGGSGGAIVIQSSSSVSIFVPSLLLATGGGGGQGGNNLGFGESGAEPTNTNAAPGGDQVNNGGNGGSGATLGAGELGASSNDGAGGGGGGTGFVRILSPRPAIDASRIVPAPYMAAR